MTDIDATLSDHEWRLKMAAEGKAFYIPGKTVEQVEAEMAANRERLVQESSRTVTMTAGEWGTIDTALSDVVEMLTDVRNVLHDLAYSDDLDRAQVNSMMRLAARAVASMEGKELHILDRLDTAIRHAPREK